MSHSRLQFSITELMVMTLVAGVTIGAYPLLGGSPVLVSTVPAVAVMVTGMIRLSGFRRRLCGLGLLLWAFVLIEGTRVRLLVVTPLSLFLSTCLLLAWFFVMAIGISTFAAYIESRHR